MVLWIQEDGVLVLRLDGEIRWIMSSEDEAEYDEDILEGSGEA